MPARPRRSIPFLSPRRLERPLRPLPLLLVTVVASLRLLKPSPSGASLPHRRRRRPRSSSSTLASTPRPLDRVGELRSGLRAPHIAESVQRHGFVAVARRPLSRSPYRAISRSVPTPLRDARADASSSPTLRPFLRRLALPPLVSSPPPRLADQAQVRQSSTRRSDRLRSPCLIIRKR